MWGAECRVVGQRSVPVGEVAPGLALPPPPPPPPLPHSLLAAAADRHSPRGRGSVEWTFGEHIPRDRREGKHGRRRETANVDDATRHRHTHYSYTLAKQLTARVTSGWLWPAAATPCSTSSPATLPAPPSPTASAPPSSPPHALTHASFTQILPRGFSIVLEIRLLAESWHQRLALFTDFTYV